jgi:hypothetical protein
MQSENKSLVGTGELEMSLAVIDIRVIVCLPALFLGHSWVTPLGETAPNLGEHTLTGNVGNANKNARNSIHQNLSEQTLRDCKTFIHRFDSDRRLQYQPQGLHHLLHRGFSTCFLLCTLTKSTTVFIDTPKSVGV